MIISYSCNSKHQDRRAIFWYWWLLSSLLEIGLPSLLTRPALEVQTGSHKYSWLSTSQSPPDRTVKNLKKLSARKKAKGSVQKVLIGWCLFMEKNVSYYKITPPMRGLEGRLVAFGHFLELSQSVWTQRDKQWSVDDVIEHPEEISKDQASYCLDPKYTLSLALIPSAARKLTLMED